MTKRNQNNLNFIMSLSDEQFDAWLNDASDDDIEYAQELIRDSRMKSLVYEMELMELVENSDMTEAMNVINKIRKMDM